MSQLDQIDNHRRKARELENLVTENVLKALERQDRVLCSKRGRDDIMSALSTPDSAAKPPEKRMRLVQPDSHARRSLFHEAEPDEVTIIQCSCSQIIIYLCEAAICLYL